MGILILPINRQKGNVRFTDTKSNECRLWKNVRMAKKAELRIYVDPKIDKKIRAIALITESNISAIAQSALEEWLEKPENQEIVQKHRLNDL